MYKVKIIFMYLNSTNLFMILPSGVVSKKLIGALIIEDNNVSCNTFDAL